MDQLRQRGSNETMLSRRSLLVHSTQASAGMLAAGTLGDLVTRLSDTSAHAASSTSETEATGTDLRPGHAITAILAAMERYPLVGLGERHMMQEMHDVITALLFHPALPGKINDIAVEFGNSAYQDVADRFILHGEQIPRAELVQIWRQIGDPAWNAPIYEQFYHSVRAVNWMLPPAQRIRVLLGQPPVTMSQVIAHPEDKRAVTVFASPMDDYFATVIEREVLSRGRRALLIAGDGHLLRGLHNAGTPPRPNAASQIVAKHPGTLYTIDLFVLPHIPPPPAKYKDNPNVKKKLAVAQEQANLVAAHFSAWPRPAVATLAGTWLGKGQSDLSYRALTPQAATFQDQADAILYLGPNEVLTASQPDPAIYHWGSYPGQLQRASAIAGAGDQLSYGITWATVDPAWWNLFNG